MKHIIFYSTLIISGVLGIGGVMISLSIDPNSDLSNLLMIFLIIFILFIIVGFISSIVYLKKAVKD